MSDRLAKQYVAIATMIVTAILLAITLFLKQEAADSILKFLAVPVSAVVGYYFTPKRKTKVNKGGSESNDPIKALVESQKNYYEYELEAREKSYAYERMQSYNGILILTMAVITTLILSYAVFRIPLEDIRAILSMWLSIVALIIGVSVGRAEKPD